MGLTKLLRPLRLLLRLWTARLIAPKAAPAAPAAGSLAVVAVAVVADGEQEREGQEGEESKEGEVTLISIPRVPVVVQRDRPREAQPAPAPGQRQQATARPTRQAADPGALHLARVSSAQNARSMPMSNPLWGELERWIDYIVSDSIMNATAHGGE